MKRAEKFITCPNKSYSILNPVWVENNYPDTVNLLLERKIKDRLSVERIADILHTAGLTAFHDYESMGKSGFLWTAFRKQIAIELSKKLGGI